MNMVTAIIARVGRATRHSVMFGHAVALLAKDAIWIEVTLEPLQTGRVIRKLAVEIFLCVLPHFRLAIHRVTYCQGHLSKSRTYCQGIITWAHAALVQPLERTLAERGAYLSYQPDTTPTSPRPENLGTAISARLLPNLLQIRVFTHIEARSSAVGERKGFQTLAATTKR